MLLPWGVGEALTLLFMGCRAQGDAQLYEGPCWIPDFSAPLSKLPCFERVAPAAQPNGAGPWHAEE